MKRKNKTAICMIIFMVAVLAYGIYTVSESFLHSGVVWEYQKKDITWLLIGQQHGFTDIIFVEVIIEQPDKNFCIYYGEGKILVDDITTAGLSDIARSMNCLVEKQDGNYVFIYQENISGIGKKVLSLKFDDQRLVQLIFWLPGSASMREKLSDVAFFMNGVRFSLPLSKDDVMKMWGTPDKKSRSRRFP
jgi:hypothetical protein